MSRFIHDMIAYLTEGSGCFLPDKMIAPGRAMPSGRLPPAKAEHGFGSGWRAGFKLRAIKCMAESKSLTFNGAGSMNDWHSHRFYGFCSSGKIRYTILQSG
jgi:hypothetical protein